MNITRTIFKKAIMATILAIVSTSAHACSGSSDDEGPGDGDGKEWKEQSLSIASWNIEFDSSVPWTQRRENVVDLITRYDFDLIGTQEPYYHQVQYLKANLKEYGSSGTSVSGDPEDTNCHNNLIFYKKSRLELLDEGSFWFSETPDVPNTKSWDSYGVRMCNWAKFRDLKTGNELFLFSCHFDHRGEVAREHTTALVKERVAKIAAGYHAFVVGDLNFNQHSDLYKSMMQDFRDTHEIASARDNADWHTYNAYVYTEVPRYNGERIDQILLRPSTLTYQVNRWSLINDSYDKKYPSDHFPVAISYSFK